MDTLKNLLHDDILKHEVSWMFFYKNYSTMIETIEKDRITYVTFSPRKDKFFNERDNPNSHLNKTTKDYYLPKIDPPKIVEEMSIYISIC